MQEEVENRTVTLAISTTKLTARTLRAAIRKLLAAWNKGRDKAKIPEIPHGKQTVKQLIGQNAGVSNIEITDSNIKSFEKVARKYGVDYAVKQDRSVYCAEESEGKQMAGIFIYTASGDSEGTLGGLVRQGKPDAFPKIFKRAIDGAKTCSNDPVCILSHGQGRESLNLAACHACALLPETCCEERNGFLDRGVVVGTYDHPQLGFYNTL